MLPETKYAQSGDVSIAYQVIGDGPLDLLIVPGFISHLEQAWDDPSYTRFLQRLASFSRLIRFDKRGTGLSDRIAEIPTLEQRMDDVRVVMDAVGSQARRPVRHLRRRPDERPVRRHLSGTHVRPDPLRQYRQGLLGPGLSLGSKAQCELGEVARNLPEGMGWSGWHRVLGAVHRP